MSRHYEETGTAFYNPYNFVPLEEKCKKEASYKDRKEKGNLTGWIECELETRTPIFIPNTTSVREDKSDIFKFRNSKDQPLKSYDFFSYTDLTKYVREGIEPPEPEPIIPGSEIRGVIRSAYETMTNSCLGSDLNQVLYKRSTVPGKPGILKKNGDRWEIQPCERIGIKVKSFFHTTINDRTTGEVIYDASQVNVLHREITDMREGQAVAIEIYEKKYTKWINNNPKGLFHEVMHIEKKHIQQGYESIYSPDKFKFNGYFHQGEPFQKKHHESVFVPLGQPPIPIDDQRPIKNYLENLKLYQNDRINQALGTNGYTGYAKCGDAKKLSLDNLDGSLIYYLCYKKSGKNYYYIAPAAIARQVFENKISDLLKDSGHEPCEDHGCCCEACVLFGLAGKQNAAASRVRFSDAIVKEGTEPEFDNRKRTLKELASPKISSTEFYLKEPGKSLGANIWNYDYGLRWTNADTPQIVDYNPKIRGRKYYWHHRQRESYDIGSNVSDRQVHVRPLKDGHFTFKVYFNNISRQELVTLLWILEIGGSESNAHKIGMGKPIGLGSVRISVNGIHQRTILNKSGKIIFSIEQIEKPEYDKEASFLTTSQTVREDFLKITEFESAPTNVKYPFNLPQDLLPRDKSHEHIFSWFVANKDSENFAKPKFQQSLPTINSNEKLKAYQKLPPNQNRHRNNRR